VAGAAGPPPAPRRRARDAELVAIQWHIERLERDLHQVKTAMATVVVLLAANGGLNVVQLLFA
jgi:hypothetical protein